MFLINFWSLFQVQSHLHLSIVNYGVSKHYTGFMMSDRCPLGYLFVIYVHEKALLKLDYLFCIALVCSESQQVFKYMEYSKSLSFNNILKCDSNKINETRCNNLLTMCKG